MINNSICFIVGAGASQSYGFPSGSQLLLDICRFLDSPGSVIFNFMLSAGFDEDALRDFSHDLNCSGVESIDTFLLRRKKYTDIGRLAIGLLISTAEHNSRLTDRLNADHWLQYIYQKMDCAISDIGKNKISFITFNYDRTIERYLSHTIRHTYGLTENESIEALNSIPIIHVNGSLGSLDQSDKKTVRYETEDLQRIVNLYREGLLDLKFYHELNGKLSNEIIKDIYSRYDSFVFIGFGYHLDNIDKLGEISSGAKNVYGSAYGLKEAQRAAVSANFRGKIELGFGDQKVLDFIKYHIAL